MQIDNQLQANPEDTAVNAAVNTSGNSEPNFHGTIQASVSSMLAHLRIKNLPMHSQPILQDGRRHLERDGNYLTGADPTNVASAYIMKALIRGEIDKLIPNFTTSITTVEHLVYLGTITREDYYESILTAVIRSVMRSSEEVHAYSDLSYAAIGKHVMRSVEGHDSQTHEELEIAILQNTDEEQAFRHQTGRGMGLLVYQCNPQASGYSIPILNREDRNGNIIIHTGNIRVDPSPYSVLNSRDISALEASVNQREAAHILSEILLNRLPGIPVGQHFLTRMLSPGLSCIHNKYADPTLNTSRFDNRSFAHLSGHRTPVEIIAGLCGYLAPGRLDGYYLPVRSDMSYHRRPQDRVKVLAKARELGLISAEREARCLAHKRGRNRVTPETVQSNQDRAAQQ